MSASRRNSRPASLVMNAPLFPKGLAGKQNGELLSFVEQAGFQVFVTLDKGIRYQQNLAGRNIAILIIRTRSNRLIDLLPHADACLAALSTARAGEVVVIGSI